MNRPHIPGLDGLRGLCILIVLFGHGGGVYPVSGGAGVDIFFVLSGFLITTILHAEGAALGKINFGNFYARRLLRLTPCLLLVCAFVAAEAAFLGEQLPLKQIGIVLAYVANWARGVFDFDLTPLTHCWSLAIEEQFYLIWPLAILALDRRIRSPVTKASILLGFAFALAVYRACMVGHFSAVRIYTGLDTHMDGLILGAALSYAVVVIRSRGGLPEVSSKVLGWFLSPVALIGILMVMRFITWRSPLMGWIGFSLVAVAAAAMIADLVLGRHSLMSGVFSVAAPRFLGKISYGLYLWHYPLYHTVDRLTPGFSVAARLSIKLPLSIAIAAISFYAFERHFLRLKHRFDSRVRKKALAGIPEAAAQ